MARLARTAPPGDPLDVVMPEDFVRWPRPLRDKLTGTLTPAGVLIPVMHRDDALGVLLTQRAAALRHHAGQVSFPGGRMERHDADVKATALRETFEEVGIRPEMVEVIGYLESMPTVTGFAVTPIVGLVPGDTELAIDRTEVEYVFEVPLDWLLDTRNDRVVERKLHGRVFPMVEFHFEGQRIWGATAMMLVRLRQYLLKQ